jgi:DNA-binding MarR family transcriptional regulator
MQKPEAIDLATRILAGEMVDPKAIASELLRESLSPQELQVLQILGSNELDTPTINERFQGDAKPILHQLSSLGLVESYIAEHTRFANVAGRRPNIWRVAGHVPVKVVQYERL